MEIKRNGSQPSSKGPAESFTGSVRRDPILTADAPSRLATGYVTFEPGARTHWHTHPVGQLLIITNGCGQVGTWDGAVEEVKAGDVVWFAPGEKHWHGAGPETAMTHIAVTEAVDGSAVAWMEPVNDDQFAGK
jgi:quercetin dioxygenase-like cupin family protein